MWGRSNKLVRSVLTSARFRLSENTRVNVRAKKGLDIRLSWDNTGRFSGFDAEACNRDFFLERLRLNMSGFRKRRHVFALEAEREIARRAERGSLRTNRFHIRNFLRAFRPALRLKYRRRRSLFRSSQDLDDATFRKPRYGRKVGVAPLLKRAGVEGCRA